MEVGLAFHFLFNNEQVLTPASCTKYNFNTGLATISAMSPNKTRLARID